jgi:hypothetical protein
VCGLFVKIDIIKNNNEKIIPKEEHWPMQGRTTDEMKVTVQLCCDGRKAETCSKIKTYCMYVRTNDCVDTAK